MPKFKVTYKRQRVLESEIFILVNAKTKKEVEELAKKTSPKDFCSVKFPIQKSTYKVTYKKKQTCDDLMILYINGIDKTNVEEILSNNEMSELMIHYGSLTIANNKKKEEDWKPTVSIVKDKNGINKKNQINIVDIDKQYSTDWVYSISKGE